MSRLDTGWLETPISVRDTKPVPQAGIAPLLRGRVLRTGGSGYAGVVRVGPHALKHPWKPKETCGRQCRDLAATSTSCRTSPILGGS